MAYSSREAWPRRGKPILRLPGEEPTAEEAHALTHPREPVAGSLSVGRGLAGHLRLVQGHDVPDLETQAVILKIDLHGDRSAGGGHGERSSETGKGARRNIRATPLPCF